MQASVLGALPAHIHPGCRVARSAGTASAGAAGSPAGTVRPAPESASRRAASAGTFETIGVEQAMCSSATMHHAWRSLTPMVWAASATRACSFWVNGKHLVD